MLRAVHEHTSDVADPKMDQRRRGHAGVCTHGSRPAGRPGAAGRHRWLRRQRLAPAPDELHPGGDRHPRSAPDHGHEGGARGALRDPAAADLGVRQHRSLRADVLPADRRAALLLLVHRCFHRDGVSLAHERRAGTLRPDDHRVQPCRHVRGRSHPARAADLSRRLFRNRRVHGPQGIRVRKSGGREGKPAPIRRSIGFSISRATWGSS